MDQNTLFESRPDLWDGSRQAGRQQCLTQLSIFSRRRARAVTLDSQGCLQRVRLLRHPSDADRWRGGLSWPLRSHLERLNAMQPPICAIYYFRVCQQRAREKTNLLNVRHSLTFKAASESLDLTRAAQVMCYILFHTV